MGDTASQIDPMPYSIIQRVKMVEGACRGTGRKKSLGVLEEPLNRMRRLASLAPSENQALFDTIAFAHCVLARKVDIVKKGKACGDDQYRRSPSNWRKAASDLSSRVAKRECA